MTDRVYRVLFPFCGIGGGALGFKRAMVELRRLGLRGRFEIMGGIECDPSTARDFTRLTGAPCLCARVEDLTPEMLREFFGGEAPDVVFFSPPCKPASGLLAAGIAATPKYRAMAMLGSVWTDLMFATWPSGPRLTIMENVPRVKTRAPEMMAQIRAAHRNHGYHTHESTHDLGEVGGLGQHRDRLLFVARRKDVSSLLYQPIKRRVRSIGEIIGALPLPGDPAAGPLHRLPAIEAITALRLALIPAGGDWHNLPSVVHLHPAFAALLGSKRRKPSNRTPFNDVWRVVRMDDAAPCVTAGATPSAGGLCIADTRLTTATPEQILAWTRNGVRTPGTPMPFKGKYEVRPWDEASRTVIGGNANGASFVADPRAGATGPARPNGARNDDHGVVGWDDASGTITGQTRPSNGRFSVADPRPTAENRYGNNWRVESMDEPAHTVTGQDDIQAGAPCIADPRTTKPSHPHTYGVVPWDGASHTITGNTVPGGGPFTVADARITCKTRDNSGIYGVMPWDVSSGCIVGHACHDNGRFSVADPQAVERLREFVARCPFPVIIAADGTIHRPLTTLECALLQSLRARTAADGTDGDDVPLMLEGTKDEQRVKVGDMVPSDAAESIAEQMLLTLVYADAGSFALSSAGGVWVRERALAEVFQ